MNNSNLFKSILTFLFCAMTSVTLSAQTLTVLHSFTGADDSGPQAALIQGSDGNLYGTTVLGGTNNIGTVFKMTPDGTSFTTLHSFTGPDGGYPVAALIQGSDGNLYGTTVLGGTNVGQITNGQGTVFKMTPDGTSFTTLHSFTGADGGLPYAALIQGSDGNLYGATAVGGFHGANDFGTVFRMTPDGTSFTTLHSFTGGADGGSPSAALIQGSDGNLYGTTTVGGTNNQGTVFKMTPDGTSLTTLHSFTGADGAPPRCRVDSRARR